MPVISWARTVLNRPGRGGALVRGFDIEDVRDKAPIGDYGDLTPELMWNNLQYFLDAVVPVAEKYQIKSALHPDDPPVAHIQGIPRIMTSVDAFKRLLTLAPSPFNGITHHRNPLCYRVHPGTNGGSRKKPRINNQVPTISEMSR